MGVPPMINGGVAGSDQGRETFEIRMAQGRDLAVEDEGSHVTTLGSDIARKYDKHVGDTIDLKGVPFEVVGILEPTLTAPDQAAGVPFTAAQELLQATLPPAFKGRVAASDLVTSIVVFPEGGVDPEVLADRIEGQLPNVVGDDRSLTSTSRSDQQRRSSIRSWWGLPSSASLSAACRSSTRWPCRSPSGPVRSASSARSAGVASASFASSSPRPP